MIKEIIKGSEKKFGRAIIFIAFAIISLIAAFVLFKFLNSSGIMTIVFPQEQGKADLGGAIVGFLLTLWLLIKNLDSADEKDLTLKGRVQDVNNLAVANASVIATTAKHAEFTNQSGYFSIEVKPQKEWKVRATYQDQSTDEITVKANETDDFIELKLSQKKTS